MADDQSNFSGRGNLIFVGCCAFFAADVLLGIRPDTLLAFKPSELNPSVYRVALAIAIVGLAFANMFRWSSITRLCVAPVLAAVIFFAHRHVPPVMHIIEAKLAVELPSFEGESDVETGTLPDAPPALMPPQTPIMDMDHLERYAPTTRRALPKPRADNQPTLFAGILRWLDENSKPAPHPGEPNP
ncbi:MAG: hypothetical protein WDN31_05640 [Hyphomicrobium sp.]